MGNALMNLGLPVGAIIRVRYLKPMSIVVLMGLEVVDPLIFPGFLRRDVQLLIAIPKMTLLVLLLALVELIIGLPFALPVKELLIIIYIYVRV